MGSYGLPVRSAPAFRYLVICASGVITALLFGPALRQIVSLGIHSDRYLQILIAPLACGLLLYLERTELLARPLPSPRIGIALLSFAVLLGIVSKYAIPRNAAASLALTVSAMVLVWHAAFLACQGVASFRAAIYPLSCLFLMVPVPLSWLDRTSTFLQHGSAALAFRILRLTGIPVFRQGMLFSLPGLDFEVGPECSGIHSSLALMMIAIVAGYLYLRSGWMRAALIVLTVPIALFKNAVRIVAITILGSRVDRAFIDGPFHHRYGGVLFSLVAAALLVLVLAGLQRLEMRRPHRETGIAPGTL